MIKISWEKTKKDKKPLTPAQKVRMWRWISLVAIVFFAIASIIVASLYFYQVKAYNDYATAKPYLIAFVVVHSISMFAIIVFYLIFQFICVDYFDGKEPKPAKKADNKKK